MCSPKTMLKIGLVLAVILGGAFVFFPQIRPTIIYLAPFALFALCPISMIFCMKGMNKDKDGKTCDDCDSKGREKTSNQIEPHAH